MPWLAVYIRILSYDLARVGLGLYVKRDIICPVCANLLLQVCCLVIL